MAGTTWQKCCGSNITCCAPRFGL